MACWTRAKRKTKKYQKNESKINIQSNIYSYKKSKSCLDGQRWQSWFKFSGYKLMKILLHIFLLWLVPCQKYLNYSSWYIFCSNFRLSVLIYGIIHPGCFHICHFLCVQIFWTKICVAVEIRLLSRTTITLRKTDFKRESLVHFLSFPICFLIEIAF